MNVAKTRRLIRWASWVALCILPWVCAWTWASADSAAVQKVLSDPARSEADRLRDHQDKAGDLIAFFNFSEGDNVVDVFAGGGYWSELFAAAVGQTGHVLVHNNEAYKKFVGPNVHLRFENKPFPQVSLYDREVDDLGLAAASQDVIYMGLSFHDLYFIDEKNGWPAIDSAQFLQQLVNALNPGGRLIIVDHNAVEGSGASSAQTLHRIDRLFVVKVVESHGLKLLEQSALLANASDDLTLSVFDASVRGKTDRFVLTFVKP